MQQSLSTNDKRNKLYTEFLASSHKGMATVNEIVRLGYKLMRKQKLHHHFFGDDREDYSLFNTAEYLSYHVLKDSHEHSNKNIHDKIDIKQAKEIFALFERRIVERIPVEYITNTAYYSGNKYYVNEDVLVPRSLMNTRFNDFLKWTHRENNRVLDLCTGSGCIGITLALLDAKIQVDLADISPRALEVSRMNINQYALSGRVNCIESNLFSDIQNKYDLIISNPPYVSTSEYNKSAEEFKREPKIALEAGPDGLDMIDIILAEAKEYLNPNGILIVEVGFSAAKRLKKKYPHLAFQWFKYRKSYDKDSWLESIFGSHGVFLCKRADLPS